MTAVLEVENLCVAYVHHGQAIPAVREVSFSLEAGASLGIVGESGCGKSTLALALVGLLPAAESRVPEGAVLFHDRDLLTQSPEAWRQTRGKNIAMIFQDPFSSLNPVLTVEYQLLETLKLNGASNAREEALDWLRKVQLTDPERILTSYPHQLSGGQRQRVLIAIALSRHPELLIADEPTTALDVTVQDEIVKLLKNLQTEMKMAMIFITHNMGLVKGLSENLAVMYAGQFVEVGPTLKLLSQPKHPYTQGLLRCIPSLKKAKGVLAALEGAPPDPRAVPPGCPFHPRCPEMMEVCPKSDPEERQVEGVDVRCHLY